MIQDAMFSRVSAVEVSHNFRNPNPDDLHQDMMLNFFGSSRTCTWNGAKWTMTLERCYNDILKVFFPFEKLSYRFPILETSATALCGTTGNWELNMIAKVPKRQPRTQPPKQGVTGYHGKMGYIYIYICKWLYMVITYYYIYVYNMYVFTIH